MAVRNGLLRAFQEIEAALNGIEDLPDVDLTPLPPSGGPFPALYMFWDEETFEMQNSDLKWIHPLNARAIFKVWLYVESEQPTEMVHQLMEKVQQIKDAIQGATLVATEWKGNVIQVEPMYGFEQRVWAAAQLTIQIGEYL